MAMDSNNKSLKNNRNRSSDFILNIIANDDGSVHGKVEHCKSGEAKYFRSLIEMTILINEKLDELEQEPANQIRSWTRRPIPISLKGGKVL